MKRPWISVNMVISLDGKISTHLLEPAIFSSDEDSQRLLELRADCDVLMVGRETWEKDQMMMTVPEELRQKSQKMTQPVRCVVSHSGAWNAEHPMFKTNGGEILLASRVGKNAKRVEQTKQMSFESLSGLMQQLASLEYKHVHCEGGGKLVRLLLEENLVDELFLTWAGHLVTGGKDAPTLTGTSVDFLQQSESFELVSMQTNNSGECFLRYLRQKKG